MNITIIHEFDCPLCERAIDKFTRAGFLVELRESLFSITDPMRRDGMLADMMVKGGDLNAVPQVFFDDRFIPDWEQEGA